MQRWQQLSGKQATLDADGRRFDEIGKERRKEGAADKAEDLAR